MKKFLPVLFLLLAINLMAETIMFYNFDNDFQYFFNEWTQNRVQGMSAWTIAQGGHNDHPSDAHSGNRNAFLYKEYGLEGTQIQQLITPPMDISNYTYVYASMWFASEAWFLDSDWLYVYYRESEEDEWHSFWSPNSGTDYVYCEQLVGTLPNAHAFQLMFEGYADGGFGLCLDDIHIFGTPIGPGVAIDPLPHRSETGVGQDTSISWTNTGTTTEVEILFDTVNPPQTVVYSGTAIDTLTNAQIGGPFALGTTCYWQVNAINDTLQTNGMLWSFCVAEPPPGHLVASPDTVSCTLASGTQQERSLSLSNTGGQELDYSITVMGSGSRALLHEDFESGVYPPDGWQTYRLGATDDRAWIESTYDSHSPTHSIVHPDDDYNSMAHDWIVTPAVTICPNSHLQFWEKNQYVYGNYYTYHGVWISTGSGDPADNDFIELIESGTEIDNWTLRSIDLADYIGQTVYIGFYYIGDYDSVWRIDDVTITGETPPAWLTVSGEQQLEDNLLPGSTQSLAVEFDASGMSPGTYRASLLIVPQNDQGLIVKPVVMEVIESLLLPPEEVTIARTGNQVDISWNTVDGATSYAIYACDRPDGDFTELVWNGSGNSWSATETDSRKFYYVRARID